MKAGDRERHYCEDCAKEFEVIYKPKAVGKPKEILGIEDTDIEWCPFCGNSLPEEDDSGDE